MESRRSFIKKTVGILGAGVIMLKSHLALAKKLAIPLDKIPGLKKVGGWTKVKLSGTEILFVRENEKSVRSVSPKCTHQECPLNYNKDTNHLDCHCHGSSFDLSGKVLKGPATKNLKTYPTVLQDNRIVIDIQ